MIFEHECVRMLQRLDATHRRRIINKINELSEHVAEVKQLRLRGEFYPLCKLRVGDWRIIYFVDWVRKTIRIYHIGHRRDIYEQ